MNIFGFDFTSAPRNGKAIMLARATLIEPPQVAAAPRVAAPPATDSQVTEAQPSPLQLSPLRATALQVTALQGFTTFAAFEAFLATPGPWVAGFDFPFGLPRRFVQAQLPGVNPTWADVTRWMHALGREEFCRRTYEAFRAAKGNPAAKHRAIDIHAASHSPLKTMDVVRRFAVNPPVGLMLFEGAPRLLAAGLCVPGLHDNGDTRIALETYPGFIARALTEGERYYKNDKPGTAARRRAAREAMVLTLRAGQSLLGLPVRLSAAVKAAALDDASGDSIDAVLCAVAAAWAALQGPPHYGLPKMDPVEGWIVGVPGPTAVSCSTTI